MNRYCNLWHRFAGFKSAWLLYKCVVFFVLDTSIMAKTALCLNLNGFIFLGSISVFRYALEPGSRWLLEAGVRPWAGQAAVASLLSAFQLLYNALWLFPVYLISLVINCRWYNEIAEKAFVVHQKRSNAGSPAVGVQQAGSLSIAVGQELYRTILFAVFFLQIMVVRCIPFGIGKVLEFVLLSWLYAFYCFDYKWVLMKKPLAARIALFESQWAFYGGFGAVCTLATVPASFYVGAAVMAVLFPLFILMACDTSPRDHMQQVTEVQGSPPLQLGSLPIFWSSTFLTGLLLRNFNNCMAFMHVFQSPPVTHAIQGM